MAASLSLTPIFSFHPPSMELVVAVVMLIKKSSLMQNLMSAAEVYIQRCNKAPCGDTEIHLYLGADSSELQNRRERLLKFLKGSQKEKVKLQKENPEEYSSFESLEREGTAYGKNCFTTICVFPAPLL